MSLKVGDKVVAKPNTVAAIFAEGRIGVITELYNPYRRHGYMLSSDDGGRNLIRGGDDGRPFGFRLNEVEHLGKKQNTD